MMVMLFSFFQFAYSQEGLTIASNNSSEMSIEYRLMNIEATSTDGRYALLSSPATNSHSHQVGAPELPQQRALIAIPAGGHTTLTITNEEWDTLRLSDLSIEKSIRPFGGANPKETMLPLAECDSLLYSSDTMIGFPLLSIESLGIMRSTSLAAITLSPIRYNPSQGTIAVCRKMSATLTFTGESAEQEEYNPMLRAMSVAMPRESKSYHNRMAGDSVAQVYLVVGTTHYRETLQPLLRWKRQEGYVVEEMYFDGYVNNDELKDSLQSRYDNATAEHPAPLYILIVGDMGDIALWPPRHLIPGLETYRSDFYYSEFTGDMLPDALIGRISVEDTTQLRQVVEKTVAYEKGEIGDTLSLRRSLLVAGKEEMEPAPTATNGQVNYLKNLIIDHDPEHDTICFYNPTSAEMRNNIIAALRAGVGLVNYTSHCTSQGWRNPSLTVRDVRDSDIVEGHYFLAVNNCCRSNDVAANSFGEQLLRKAGGGAVGAIGATNETLWEEDYYWSVGFGSMAENPTIDSTSAGAFDRLLHPHIQAEEEQAWTASQMMVAGNSAVVASGSQYADYYWEVYLLLGDPSLMPHLGPLQQMILECDSVAIGDTVVALRGTPWAQVAATCGDTLVGLCRLDGNGEATMQFRQPIASNLCITATRQFHIAKQITYKYLEDSVVNVITNVGSESILVYPNPTNDKITVSGITTPSTLTIYDNMGRKILETTVVDKQTLNVKQSLAPGIYTIKVTDNDRFKTQTLIISK